MALSNYLLQSAFGAALFFGFGFGMLGKLHDWQTFTIDCGVIGVQVTYSFFGLTPIVMAGQWL